MVFSQVASLSWYFSHFLDCLTDLTHRPNCHKIRKNLIIKQDKLFPPLNWITDKRICKLLLSDIICPMITAGWCYRLVIVITFFSVLDVIVLNGGHNPIRKWWNGDSTFSRVPTILFQSIRMSTIIDLSSSWRISNTLTTFPLNPHHSLQRYTFFLVVVVVVVVVADVVADVGVVSDVITRLLLLLQFL